MADGYKVRIRRKNRTISLLTLSNKGVFDRVCIKLLPGAEMDRM